MRNRISVKSKIYTIFFFSGISGLMYEIVWLRILSRVLGSTVYATSIVLASFMGGLAVGSYALGKYAHRIDDKLRFYAMLEMGIGISALVLTFLFIKGLWPIYRIFYEIAGQDRFGLTACQSILMFLLLLIPTVLMGGTLPILIAHTKRYHVSFAQRSACLYGLNTLGALIGVSASGIYLIGAVGEINTLYAGVLISLLVSLMAISLSKMKAENGLSDQPRLNQRISSYDDPIRRFILVAYAVNGFVAMAYEVIWTRIFQIQLGTSIYAFSMMLTFYLAGVAFGSLCGGRFMRIVKNPLGLFAIFQLSIALYGILGMYIFTIFEPGSLWTNMVVVPASIVFPMTFILGMIFPAVSCSYVKDEARAGREIGLLYSVNTLGCILGSLTCGFIAIRLLGTRRALLALAATNILIAVIAFCKMPLAERNYKTKTVMAGLLTASLIGGALSPDPFFAALEKVIRQVFQDRSNDVKIYVHKEGLSATVSVYGLEERPLSNSLAINGIGMTTLCIETKLMAHIPLLLHDDPKDALIICFGMGTTLRSAWTHKALRCDVVELVPEEYGCFNYFHANGSEILADPRIRYYADDGRNFLLMRPKRYDVITMDPSPPIYSAGTVNLYTKEFFELCKDRLKPRGIMCAWIPPDRYSEVRMIMKTFYAVFPNTYVFGGPYFPGFYMVGFKEMDKPMLERLIGPPEDRAILADLSEWSRVQKPQGSLLSLLLLNPNQLALFVEDTPVITDDRPYTEFPLWRSIFDKTYNLPLDAAILNDIKNQILVHFEKR